MKSERPEGPVWRRSRRCPESACVEVMQRSDGRVRLRSSLRPESELSFSAAEWEVFLAAVKQGDFD